jgi:hypothetical protein
MIIGTPARRNTLSIGTVAALHEPPTDTVTSCVTISLAAVTAVPGSHPSSPVTSSIRCPSTPPASFASVIAI